MSCWRWARIPGALAFLAGHLIAIGLYLRNRRRALAISQQLLALLIIPATVATAWMLPADRTGGPGHRALRPRPFGDGLHRLDQPLSGYRVGIGR